MALYIGANYHPHDWEEERWQTDIELMKKAGFTTVRLGHLCWDSYEPENAVYTFEWFDRVMNLFAKANIGVVLDVSMRPAPIWVHKLCPGCAICDKSGAPTASLTRYMEDVSDPAYQKYALRFANVLVNRYKNHPALFAFGLCNELGDGMMSFSEYSRQRFIVWLKQKYSCIQNLNKAWATQRWSRKLNSFDEVVLQENSVSIGPPEAWLDMRRFFSDGIADFAVQLAETVNTLAPLKPHSSNHYASKPELGFNFQKVYNSFVDYPGMGVYPGYNTENDGMLSKVLLGYLSRAAESEKPVWCLEFQSGRDTLHHDYMGKTRMYAFYCLLHRMQMMLGWTFRSMYGGEEQFHHGLLDHDGTETENYHQYCRISTEFKKLEKHGFPYLPTPEIAIGYSYENLLVTSYHKSRFPIPYRESVIKALNAVESQNRDCNVIDISYMENPYKLLIIPHYTIMDFKAIENITSFVEKGGTVIMTGNSALVDETSKVFQTPKPGGLTNVFGIQNKGFVFCNYADATKSEQHSIISNSESFSVNINYYEKITLQTAQPLAMFGELNTCAIAKNNFGKGSAYYVATEANEIILNWLINKIANEIGLCQNMLTPKGVIARKINDVSCFYLNTTAMPVEIAIQDNCFGLLSEKSYEKSVILNAFDGELLIEKKNF